MTGDDRLLLGFYGDDFTGSTDALETLALAGVRTVLFVQRPSAGDLERFEGLQAVGLAGMSRTMTPEQMNRELLPDFERLRAMNPAVVHYKTCSTFDSSPEIGSIGRATDLGDNVFRGSFVPLLVGAPRLGRYCAFGNLFAQSGLDSPIYRLDRHPTMSRHPVTPMNDSDLRRHLRQQTAKEIALFDLLSYTGPPEAVEGRLETLLESAPDVVLFDAVYPEHLETAGRLLWARTAARQSLFVVGSSGVETAFTDHWRRAGMPSEPPDFRLRATDRLIVVSGSCSPVAAAQIDYAADRGFTEVLLDTVQVLDDPAGTRRAAVRSAMNALGRGESVIIHTCKGPDDPRIAATRTRLAADSGRTAAELGRRLGGILRELLRESGLRRAIVTGGDTSGHVAHELKIDALEMTAQLTPGTPLCRVYALGRELHGLEIAFKGGQTGKVDFFDAVRRGDAARIRTGVEPVHD